MCSPCSFSTDSKGDYWNSMLIARPEGGEYTNLTMRSHVRFPFKGMVPAGTTPCCCMQDVLSIIRKPSSMTNPGFPVLIKYYILTIG